LTWKNCFWALIWGPLSSGGLTLECGPPKVGAYMGMLAPSSGGPHNNVLYSVIYMLFSGVEV